MEKSNSWEGGHTQLVCCLFLLNTGEIAEILLIIWKLNSSLNLSAKKIKIKNKPICHLVGFSLFTSILMSSAYIEHQSAGGAKASML